MLGLCVCKQHPFGRNVAFLIEQTEKPLMMINFGFDASNHRSDQTFASAKLNRHWLATKTQP